MQKLIQWLKNLIQKLKKPQKTLDKPIEVCYGSSISSQNDTVQEEPTIIKEVATSSKRSGEEDNVSKSQFEKRKLKEAAKEDVKENLSFPQEALDIIWNENLSKYEAIVIAYDVESGVGKVTKRVICFDKSVARMFEIKKQAIKNLFKLGE